MSLLKSHLVRKSAYFRHLTSWTGGPRRNSQKELRLHKPSTKWGMRAAFRKGCRRKGMFNPLCSTPEGSDPPVGECHQEMRRNCVAIRTSCRRKWAPRGLSAAPGGRARLRLLSRCQRCGPGDSGRRKLDQLIHFQEDAGWAGGSRRRWAGLGVSHTLAAPTAFTLLCFIYSGS